LMLMLLALGRRFGWKGQFAVVVLLAFLQATRDRIWFTAVLPVMAADVGIVPFLSAVAIYIAGLSIGLLIARRIGAGTQKRPALGSHAGTA